MMKRTVLLFCCGLFVLNSFSQDATKILDSAASKIRKSGSVKVEFTASSSNSAGEQGKTSGTMLLQGKKFQLTTPEMITWFDGHTQWSYVPENEEVNITNPTETEIQVINPYIFLDVYKKGYDNSLRETKSGNQPSYEVHLQAQKEEMSTQEIYITVRKSDCSLLGIRARQSDVWTSITIKSIAGNQKFKDADFTFPAYIYPNVEVIDLR